VDVDEQRRRIATREEQVQLLAAGVAVGQIDQAGPQPPRGCRLFRPAREDLRMFGDRCARVVLAFVELGGVLQRIEEDLRLAVAAFRSSSDNRILIGSPSERPRRKLTRGAV